jgi:altronate dehydratase
MLIFGSRRDDEVLQDGSGYDGDSMAGLAASGSQLMFFSTGRGTPAGLPALPVIIDFSYRRKTNENYQGTVAALV